MNAERVSRFGNCSLQQSAIGNPTQNINIVKQRLLLNLNQPVNARQYHLGAKRIPYNIDKLTRKQSHQHFSQIFT